MKIIDKYQKMQDKFKEFLVEAYPENDVTDELVKHNAHAAECVTDTIDFIESMIEDEALLVDETSAADIALEAWNARFTPKNERAGRLALLKKQSIKDVTAAFVEMSTELDEVFEEMGEDADEEEFDAEEAEEMASDYLDDFCHGIALAIEFLDSQYPDESFFVLAIDEVGENEFYVATAPPEEHAKWDNLATASL